MVQNMAGFFSKKSSLLNKKSTFSKSFSKFPKIPCRLKKNPKIQLDPDPGGERVPLISSVCSSLFKTLDVGRNLFLLKGKLRPLKPPKKNWCQNPSLIGFSPSPPKFFKFAKKKKKQRKNDSHEVASVKGWILNPFYPFLPPPNYRGIGGLKGKW